MNPFLHTHSFNAQLRMQGPGLGASQEGRHPGAGAHSTLSALGSLHSLVTAENSKQTWICMTVLFGLETRTPKLCQSLGIEDSF